MTVKKFEYTENVIEKAKARLGKPYSQQLGRKPGKGAGKIVHPEGKKRFKVQNNIGSAKYVLNFHDGNKKHSDGSDFYDMKIFRNKKDLEQNINDLYKEGYVEESMCFDKAGKPRIGKPYSQQKRQSGKGAGKIVTPTEKLKEAQETTGVETDYVGEVWHMVEDGLLNEKQAHNLLEGLSTLQEEYQIKYAKEIAQQRSKGITEHGFDKAGFSSVENFTKLLKKYDLTNHEVYAYEGKVNSGTTDVWSNDEGLKLITSGNPINKKGYSHYIGIEGNLKQADKLFDDIESLNDFEAAEFGMSGYIGTPDSSYQKMSSEKLGSK